MTAPRGADASARGAVAEDYDAQVGRVARGAGVSSAGQGVGRLSGYAAHAAVAGMHGPAQLGFYALGVTVVQVANVLSQLGLDNGVVRYVAHHGSGGDTARVRGTILQSLAVAFSLSVAFSAVLFFGAGFLAGTVFGKPFLETMFRAFAGAVPFLTLMSMALWATQGFGTVKYATLVGQVARPLANLALVVLFYLLGVEVLGAVAAYGLSMAFGAALAMWCLARAFPGPLKGEVEYGGRDLHLVSAPMVVANASGPANLWISLAVLGVFEPVHTVGVFNVAARTAALSALVLVAFGGVFAPLASGLHGQGRLKELGRLYGDVSRWAFTGALALFLTTVLLSRDIMISFGEDFASGWPVVAVVATAQLFNSSVGPTARLLAMTGHEKALMVSAALSAAFGGALGLLLVPAGSVLGAAAAMAAALVLANAAALVLVRRRLGLWPYDRRYAKPLLAGLAAGGVVLALRTTVLPDLEGLPAILVLAPLAIALFGAALAALGLDPSDRRFLAPFGAAARSALSRVRGA